MKDVFGRCRASAMKDDDCGAVVWIGGERTGVLEDSDTMMQPMQ